MTEQIIEVLKNNSSFLDRSRSEQGIHEDNFEYIVKEIEKAINFKRCCKSDSEQLKGKYPLTFNEWIKHSGYKNYGNYDYRKDDEIFTRDKLQIYYRAYHKTF